MFHSKRAYWRKILERLGRYSNVLAWEIQNEYLGNEAFQDQVAAFFLENDPHQRPIITSNGTRDVPAWPEKPWMGMAITHTCTGSTSRHPLGDWYLAVARNARTFAKPSFNNETGRETRHRNDDGVHRRKQGWLWSAAGGYWTWHSWDGCEGIDDPHYGAPGERFMPVMADFFGKLPFWKLHPEHAAVQLAYAEGGLVSASLALPDRTYLFIYLATETSGQRVMDAGLRYRLRDGRYKVSLVEPSTGVRREAGHLEARGLGTVGELPLPAFVDDLVVEFQRLDERPETLMPDTQ